jgi:hydrogenase nickel incorporation protein HypB
MCDSCCCAQPEVSVTIRNAGTEGSHALDRHQDNSPGHSHDHNHPHHDHHGRTVRVEQDLLAKNTEIARQNREYLKAHHIVALNLVSSPGSGKTTILEKTLVSLQDLSTAVIEGDQQTMHDADRIAATGAPVVQVNTGTGCHLDAVMVHRAMHRLALRKNSLLFIENVGNLVCPALFDLGEAHKVVIISVTEGEDKPQKYPHMFRAADICVINKTDLLPYVQFDVAQCRERAHQVNPNLTFFELSATTGEGIAAWLDWLRQSVSGL